MIRVTFGQKIFFVFLSAIILTAGVCTYSLFMLDKVTGISQELGAVNIQFNTLLEEAKDNQNLMRIYRERAIGAATLTRLKLKTEAPAHIIARWQHAEQKTQVSLKNIMDYSLQNSANSPVAARAVLWKKISQVAKRSQAELAELSNEVGIDFKILESGELEKMEQRLGVIDKYRERFDRSVLEQADLAKQLFESGIEGSKKISQQAWLSVALSLMGALIFSMIAAILLQRSIATPLKQFMAFARAVGEGDLTTQTRINRNDEIGDLAKYLDEMVVGLKNVTDETSSAIKSVNAASQQIFSSAQQRAATMSEQSSSVQEITSTLEEINQVGGQVAQKANDVAEQAANAAQMSRQGIEAADETHLAMESLGKQAELVAENIIALTHKTQSVGEIITKVNDIAERSNLLAFNAAIESAGAGELGERFAVVADEIRHLAEQAKSATVQVKDILQDIQQGISRSVMLTEDAVKLADSGKQRTSNTQLVIENLGANIAANLQAFQQIVASTNQQKIGVQQVTDSVHTIREASEQMTVGTRELEQAAGNLNQLGERLQFSIAKYQL